MVSARKLTTLSHKQKRELCRHKQKNTSSTLKELAAWVSETFEAKVHEATISRILKKSDALLANVTGNDVKRTKNPLCPAVEEALYKWFLAAQEGKLPVSDELLIEKGKQLHAFLLSKNSNVRDCKFSTGWVHGFKKRHNIRCRLLHSKAESLQLTEQTWDHIAALKVTLSTYEPSDVFNMDETGLFYRLQPNRDLRDEAVNSQKVDTTRISVGLCANSDGTIKLPPLVISKAKNPRAFSQRRIKRPSNLGITWYSNKKAWMKGEVFQDWLITFENHMKELGRTKVALLVDNCPGHLLGSVAKQLQITKVIFLPANTTTYFQPMDAGIIQSFKLQYRSLLVRKQLACFEKQEPVDHDVYDAVVMLVQAWGDGVTGDTIQNCWKHTDLMPYKDAGQNQCPRDLDLEAPLHDPDIEAQTHELGEYLSQLSLQFPVNLSVQEFLDSDSVENAPTFSLDADISSYLVDEMADDEEDSPGETVEPDRETEQQLEDTDGDLVPNMSYGVGMAHFGSLKTFFEQQDYDTTGMMAELAKMMKLCTKEHMKNLVQSNLDQVLELECGIGDQEIDS